MPITENRVLEIALYFFLFLKNWIQKIKFL